MLLRYNTSMNGRRFLVGLLELVKTILTVVIVAFVIRSLLAQSFRVEGSSMEPNFHNRELVLVEKVSFRLRQIKRGDVIVLVAPDQPKIDLIKRVVGLPGETLRIQANKIFIDDRQLRESYLKTNEITQAVGAPDQPYVISLKPGEYFVLGDNRQSSKDSRSIGAIPQKNIVGKVFIVIWPTKNFGLVSRPFEQAT